MKDALQRLVLALAVTVVSGCFCGNGARLDEGDGGLADTGGFDAGEDGGIADAGQDAGSMDSGANDSGANDAGDPNPCLGLTLYECRLDARCEGDLCYACSCAPSFEGCRLLADPAFECPAFGCLMPSCCAGAGDCSPPLVCLAPDNEPCGGACFPDPGDCGFDTDCATGDICEPDTCGCADPKCEPGCASDTDCAQGEQCQTTSLHPRCVPTSCGPNTPCEPDFDCVSGECRRRICNDDLACDNFCVLGRCYDSFGGCGSFPP